MSDRVKTVDFGKHPTVVLRGTKMDLWMHLGQTGYHRNEVEWRLFDIGEGPTGPVEEAPENPKYAGSLYREDRRDIHDFEGMIRRYAGLKIRLVIPKRPPEIEAE